MSRVSLPTEKEQKPFKTWFKDVTNVMGFVPNSMLQFIKVPAVFSGASLLITMFITDVKKGKPSLFFKLIWKHLGWSMKFAKDKTRISLALRFFLAHTVSRAAQCEYCEAHTIQEAEHNGASQAQLNAIRNFENSDAFSESEKAALRMAYAAGLVPNAVTDKHFEDLKKYYVDDQIMDIMGTICSFGFLNRWNSTLATKLEPIPLAKAEKYLQPSGWTIGKH